jgi:hypothetical protein
MASSIHKKLDNYYLNQGIHPEHFNCRNQSSCRKFANQGNMTETKMSLVGSQYGQAYPKIVVLSLDPPKGAEGKFVEAHQRTTDYVTSLTESENYTLNRPNVHWAMTHIIVKDILTLFAYKAAPGAAVVAESYTNRPIENASPYFAHVNAAKCSMNHPDKYQANSTVHEICSQTYLYKELEILQPEILVSQGKSANKIIDRLLGLWGLEGALPQAVSAKIGAAPVLWLPMDHPSRGLSRIRHRWPFYVEAIKKWKEMKILPTSSLNEESGRSNGQCL